MGKEYLQIDLKELVMIILNKWWMFVILFIVFASGTYFYTVNYVEPVYQGNVTLFIGKEQDSINGIELSVSELYLNNQLIVDYKQIARTRYVVEKVIDQLDLNMNVAMFKKAMAISIIEDSRLFQVSFKSNDPVIARDAANELAMQLSIAVYQIVNVENIQVVDEALLPAIPVSPNVYKNTFVGGVLGILIGVIIIFLGELLNNTFKNEKEIAKELGTPILGRIPEFKGGKFL